MRHDTGSIRVSSDEQKKKGQMVNAYKADIIRQGVKPEDIIIELATSGSIDDDKDIKYRLNSGKLIMEFDLKKKRPLLYDWLENKVLKNIVRTHYVNKWDRLARNIPLGRGIISICKQYGTNVVAINDTDNPMGIQFSMMLAEMESNLTKGRVKSGKEHKFELGLYMGTVRLYGYKKTKIKVDGREYLHLIPNPDEEELIKDIFSNKSLTDIENQYGLNPSVTHNIRKNRFYCGFIEFNGEEKKGIHTPLISEETWHKFN